MTPETRSQRLYQRVRPTSSEAAKAQIIARPKAPVIACRLVDISRGGACLEIFPMVPLPDRFELLHGGVKKKAAWCGVAVSGSACVLKLCGAWEGEKGYG
jgi:hypothetical protein